MLRALRLVGVGPIPVTEIEFGPRINLMTGDNGLGKSFVLDLIWWALSGTWAGLPAWPRPDAGEARIEIAFDEATAHAMEAFQPNYGYSDRKLEGGRFYRWSTFNREKQNWAPWSLAFLKKPLPALVIYARSDGTFAAWDPARNHWEQQYGGGVYKGDALADPNDTRRPQSYVFDSDSILNGSELAGKTICNGLIRDWVNWQQKRPEAPGGQAFAHLYNVLEQLSPNPEGSEIIRPGAPTRLFVDDAREFPTINMGYGDTAIIHASAGVRRIISLAYLIVWTWHEHIEASRLLNREPVKNIVILMDEAENHLHPQWQRRITPALLKVLGGLGEGMGVQAHITTHAPMVLASLEPYFEPDQDKLFVFDLEEGRVILREEAFVPRGDASRWLTSQAFKLDTSRSIEAERAMNLANALMRGEELRPYKSREEIDRVLHETLPGQDPFWARWLAFIERSAI